MLPAACSAPVAEGAGSPREAGPAESYPQFGRTAGRECRKIDWTPYIGKLASSALATRARDAAGAASVRWLRPGQVVTMEYRADRLSITLDAVNKVVGIRCG